jgi:hypothetical protein
LWKDRNDESAMMSETRGELIVAEPIPMPDIDLWRANQLQLVVFPMTLPANVAEDWWRLATGQDPVEVTKKRSETTVTGPYGDGNLVLTVDQLRIFWTLTPRIDVQNPPLSLPTIGDYPGTRDIFAELTRPWIAANCPPIKRMAFTGLLMQEADSHKDAYRLLQRYLEQFVKIDPDSTDFTYRVNRPRDSRAVTFDLRINRLSTWSAMKFSVAEGSFLLGSENQGVPFRTSTARYGVILHCDVNTDAERTEEIPHENIEPLFGELLDLANEIAASGDWS